MSTLAHGNMLREALADFWREVDAVLTERGVKDVKSLKVGIASYADMKARTMAIARGALKPRPSEPKVWFTSIESFAEVLSDRNRALSLREPAHPRPPATCEPAPDTDLAKEKARHCCRASRSRRPGRSAS